MGKVGQVRCTVCLSPAAGAVDAALIAGRSASSLAAEYGFSPSAVQRHRARCIPRRLAQASEVVAVEALSPEQLLAQVTEVQARALRLADLAEAGGDIKEQAAALRELRSTVELLAKLSFAAADRPARSLESGRPDIDALIVAALEAHNPDQPGGDAGEGDDGVVEAEVVEG